MKKQICLSSAFHGRFVPFFHSLWAFGFSPANDQKCPAVGRFRGLEVDARLW
jgi:hypothetical protein